MRLKSSVLFVKDIQRSKDFYINILKQKLVSDFNVNVVFEGGLALWQLQKEHLLQPYIGFPEKSKVEIYFEENELEQLFDALKNEKVEFIHPIHTEEWGQRTLRFLDPDNHIIEVGESMEYVVGNMYRKGKSVLEIEQITGLPMEFIQKHLEQ